MTRAAAAALICLLTSCARYGDFTLPLLPGGPAVRWSIELRPDPVIQHGSVGDWDAKDALNPSVVRQGVQDGEYLNLYSGFDGATWHTGLATSPDGLLWRKRGKVLSPDSSTWEGAYMAANGAALALDGEILYWYQSGARNQPQIGLARSRDGRIWSKVPLPVLRPGPRGSWDERGVADPYVVRFGGRFYLYYLGQDRARRQRLGVAVSEDGIAWTKLRSNPVMELGEAGAFDEAGLGEPAVWASHGSYWMLYTGRDRMENRRIGLAHSSDGVYWERTRLVVRGNAAWDSRVVCDPTVEAQGDTIRLWFGGGDVASPDENLNGQIGVGFLRLRRD